MKKKMSLWIALFTISIFCFSFSATSYAAFNNAGTTRAATIKLNKRKVILYTKGRKEIQLKAVVKGSNAEVVWKSNNRKVATVSPEGKVTAKRPGSAMIYAKANGKKAACKVIVRKPTIKLNKRKAVLYTSGNKKMLLKAVVKGPSRKVVWKSSNKKVAVVTSKGKVIARRPGMAVIMAKANGVTAKCKVVVKKKQAVTAVSWKTLYKSFLEKGSVVIPGKQGNINLPLSIAEFTIGDIDCNGIEELLVRVNAGLANTATHIFTIKNGKVIYTGDVWNVEDTPRISKQYGGIYHTWYAAGCANFYLSSLKNDKVSLKKQIVRYYDKNKAYYYIDGKPVSKMEYTETLKKYEASLEKTERFMSNNMTNRIHMFGR